MIFTGLYLESSRVLENEFLKNFFEIEIKVDVLILRMTLDIVTKCLRSVEICQEVLDNSTFVNESINFNSSNIIDSITEIENDNKDFKDHKISLG
jgi:hypothetical protein